MLSDNEHHSCQVCQVRFTWHNLLVNLALAVLKGFIGVVAASRALMACALYSINDVLSAVIVLISLRIAHRPPDRDHAYGHGKVEFLAIAIVSVVLAAAVVFILSFSVADLLRGVTEAPHLVALLVAMVTLGTNEFIARKGYCVSCHTGSQVIQICADHNRADAISSGLTTVGVGAAILGLHMADPLVAILETVHIMWLSGSLFGHSLKGLMDSALPEPEVHAAREACAAVPGVRGLVSLRTRQAGQACWADVEVAVDGGLRMREAMQIQTLVKRAAKGALMHRANVHVKLSSEPGRAGAVLPQPPLGHHA